MAARQQQPWDGDRQHPAEPAQIRLQTTRIQRFLPLAPSLAILTTITVTLPNGESIWMRLTPLAAFIVVGVLGSLAQRRVGVLLTADALFAIGLRTRRIRPADIQVIWIDSLLGVKRVVIDEAGGRETKLRAPLTGFMCWDRGFEEKFHTIGQWWLANRGTDWRPVPPPVGWTRSAQASSVDPWS